MPYRQRRLNYLDGRIERLLRFDDRGYAFLMKFAGDASLADVKSLERDLDVALRNAKQRLSKVFIELRGDLAGLSRDDELGTLFGAVGLTPADLTAILAGARGQAESISRAAELIAERKLMTALDTAAHTVADKVSQPLIDAAARVETALESDQRRRRSEGNGDRLGGPRPPAGALRGLRLRAAADGLPGGGRGRSRRGDPDQPEGCGQPDRREHSRRPSHPEKKRTKLAGVAIGHFGGFFEQGWRKNDILWGRLDAAERIIETILSAGTTRGKSGARRIRQARSAGDHPRGVRRAAWVAGPVLPPR